MSSSHDIKALLAAVRVGKVAAVRAVIEADPEVARQGRLVVAAGRGPERILAQLPRAARTVAGRAARGGREARARAAGWPDFARDRDHGGLTAPQCAAGSRMPKA